MTVSYTHLDVYKRQLFALRTGDLIFMGTPAGVAALQPGDEFDARIGDALQLRGKITPSAA